MQKTIMSEEKVFPVEPIHCNIVILPFAADDVSKGGIIVPDSVKERPSKGTVMAVGGGLKEREMVLKPGDVVLHVKNAGTEIEVDGTKYYLMRDNECLSKLH
jgi:chaperonin GroES